MAIAFMAKMITGLMPVKLTAMPTGTNIKRILIGLLSNISFAVIMKRLTTFGFSLTMEVVSSPCSCVSLEGGAGGGDADTPSTRVLLDVV